ncbi:unnamed protein product [marine sediment metagenome]|uniref:Uncharacterized protein n=1 Tax=marine sediment metagenome TaxID=412755 RepID=X1TL14_9ZZZZ
MSKSTQGARIRIGSDHPFAKRCLVQTALRDRSYVFANAKRRMAPEELGIFVV